MKRQLRDEEKQMIIKNVGLIREDLEYKQAILKEKNVLLEIAPIKYKHQVSMMEAERNSIQDEVEEHTKAIAILLDQVENGVDSKNVAKKLK